MPRKTAHISLDKAISHFRTIGHHRALVLRGCFAVGLYRQGLLHDLSKYSPVEFLVGARYYQGTRSPNNAEREDKGYSAAWLHHKGRNMHHYEYWMDYVSRPQDRATESPVIPVRMPGRFVVEMFMDRIAASKTYRGDAYTDADPWNYYSSGKADALIHPDTRALLEELLKMLRDEGEAAAFAHIRAHLSKKRGHRRRAADR